MTEVLPGAASLTAAAHELIGPLSGAATPEPLPLTDAATFGTGAPNYRPLLLVRLLRDLADEAYLVTLTVDSVAQPVLRFAPWTERGSQLVGFVAATDSQGSAAAFTGSVAVEHQAADGTASTLGANEVGGVIAVDLVQGNLGRLLTVLLAEDARLRRQAREIVAMRQLGNARFDALDRIGVDLGAPRLADTLGWDAAKQQLITSPLPGNREDDAHYRRRLAVLRSVRLPSPPWLDAVLNGPGAASDPGAGWLAQAGNPARVQIDESPNQLLVAFRLVAPGRRPNNLARLLWTIRLTHLTWAAGHANGDEAHAGRMLTPAAAAEVTASREALKTLGLPPLQPVAPAIATAMLALVQLQERLGVHPFKLIGGQRDDGGSRYELGLGAQLAKPAAADLDAAAQAATNLHDPALAPRPSAEDPIGGWLLSACGLRTAEQLPDGTVYVSAMSTGRLVLDVAPAPGAAGPLTITARLESATDAGHDAPLVAVIDALAAEGVTVAADPAGLIAGMQPSAAVGTLDTVLAELGLPRVSSVADVRQRLGQVAARDFAVFDLGAAVTGQIETTPTRLRDLLLPGQRAGASSVLPFVSAAGTLALALAVTDLPLAGNNLAAQHTIAYRWQLRGLADDVATLSARRGPTVTLTNTAPSNTGISLVTCLAYLRTGHNDPYQWRPSLPDGALLTLDQYEHLMNILELVTPLGVQANTWTIRRQHVDVDGSGSPTPLSPEAARTYHRYRPTHL